MGYLETKTKFHNISTIIKSVTKFTNPDTGGVLQLLPESVAKQIKRKMKQLRNSIVNTMYRVERSIRGVRAQVDGVFNKYRGSVRTRLNELHKMIRVTIKKNLDAMMKALNKFEDKIRKLAKPL